MGGWHQEVFIGESSITKIKDFDDGYWLETPITAATTSSGSFLIRIVNGNPRSNAVVSIVEWGESYSAPR
ncbi:MAG: hypothetical protein ACUVQG_11730 [Thermogutta sp.]